MDKDSHDVRDLEMDAETVATYLREDRPMTLVDIREPVERETVSLDDDEWIPMANIGDQLDTLREASKPVVVYCHHGMRSLRVAKMLSNEGMDEVYSLAGGIDYWARKIDGDLPTY